MILIHLIEGGQGSGNFGHSGRTGQVGGSAKNISVDFQAPTQQALEEFLQDEDESFTDGDYTVKLGSSIYQIRLEAWFPDCLESRDMGETNCSNIRRSYQEIMRRESGWEDADLFGYLPEMSGAEYGYSYIGRKIQ